MSARASALWVWCIAVALLAGSAVALGQESGEPQSLAESPLPADAVGRTDLASRTPEQQAQDAQTRQYWREFMHYALIARWDLAKDYGQKLIASDPDPVMVLNLAESGRYRESYRKLDQMRANTPVGDVAKQVGELIERGRFLQRTDRERIAREVKRLSSTTRARMMATMRLKDSGEWAVPVMVEVLRDGSRSDEFAVIRSVLPKIGLPAVNPLVVALQRSKDATVRVTAAKALGDIGYGSAVPYLLQAIQAGDASSELKTVALAALEKIYPGQAAANLGAAQAFNQLALDYYNHVSSLAVPANQDFGNVWFWDAQAGLVAVAVPREAFDELMSMRCCEQAVKLEPKLASAISLWLSGYFRLEAEGHSQPSYFDAEHADAATYALTAGPEYLHRSLARALDNRNRPVALAAITTLRRNSGQASLLYQLGADQPLVRALSFPDRQVRYNAALTLGGALPKRAFTQSELVVPILAEALRQKGQLYALTVDPDQDGRNAITSALRDSGAFAKVVAGETLGMTLDQAKGLESFDLVVLAYGMKQPSMREALDLMKVDYRLAFCPTLVIAAAQDNAEAEKLAQDYDFVAVLSKGAAADALLDAGQEILQRNQASLFDATLADTYATAAAEVLRSLAVTGNQALDLTVAEPALIGATQDQRATIQVLATEALAQMTSSKAQRAIAALALESQLPAETRLMAFDNLARSAKLHGNSLVAEHIEAIYQIVSSPEQDPLLRRGAAEAYGALNLPSATISRLITEQMK